MSVADASLVRMAELLSRSPVLTLDRDFKPILDTLARENSHTSYNC